MSAYACPTETQHGRLLGTVDSETAWNVLPNETAFQAHWQSLDDKTGSERAVVLGSYWLVQ